VGVEVDANKEETEAFEALYGIEDIDEAIDWLSRVLGNLRAGSPLADGSDGEAS